MKLSYKYFLSRLLLVVGSVLFSLLIVEAVFYFFIPAPRFLTGGYLPKDYVADDQLGFRPVLGNTNYNIYGTMPNGIDSITKGSRPRILFLGDSVTRRNKINKVLTSKWGPAFEFWNAGVEAYNTYQETEYFARYLTQLKPDITILFFHLNDFLVTPMISIDSEGRSIAFAPFSPPVRINAWWYKHSVLYRLFVFSHFDFSNLDGREIVRQSLLRLQSLVKEGNGSLFVAVLPIFDRLENWSSQNRQARNDILKIVSEINLCWLDTTPALSTAVPTLQLSDDADYWHPNDYAASLVGDFILAEGITNSKKGLLELHCHTDRISE